MKVVKYQLNYPLENGWSQSLIMAGKTNHFPSMYKRVEYEKIAQ